MLMFLFFPGLYLGPIFSLNDVQQDGVKVAFGYLVTRSNTPSLHGAVIVFHDLGWVLKYNFDLRYSQHMRGF